MPGGSWNQAAADASLKVPEPQISSIEDQNRFFDDWAAQGKAAHTSAPVISRGPAEFDPEDDRPFWDVNSGASSANMVIRKFQSEPRAGYFEQMDRLAVPDAPNKFDWLLKGADTPASEIGGEGGGGAGGGSGSGAAEESHLDWSIPGLGNDPKKPWFSDWGAPNEDDRSALDRLRDFSGSLGAGTPMPGAVPAVPPPPVAQVPPSGALRPPTPQAEIGLTPEQWRMKHGMGSTPELPSVSPYAFDDQRYGERPGSAPTSRLLDGTSITATTSPDGAVSYTNRLGPDALFGPEGSVDGSRITAQDAHHNFAGRGDINADEYAGLRGHAFQPDTSAPDISLATYMQRKQQEAEARRAAKEAADIALTQHAAAAPDQLAVLGAEYRLRGQGEEALQRLRNQGAMGQLQFKAQADAQRQEAINKEIAQANEQMAPLQRELAALNSDPRTKDLPAAVTRRAELETQLKQLQGILNTRLAALLPHPQGSDDVGKLWIE